jgi:hypothetical protein
MAASHCHQWWKWWSDSLWVTLTRLWPDWFLFCLYWFGWNWHSFHPLKCFPGVHSALSLIYLFTSGVHFFEIVLITLLDMDPALTRSAPWLWQSDSYLSSLGYLCHLDLDPLHVWKHFKKPILANVGMLMRSILNYIGATGEPQGKSVCEVGGRSWNWHCCQWSCKS